MFANLGMVVSGKIMSFLVANQGAWDLIRAFDRGKGLAKKVGSAFFGLVGIALIVHGGYKLAKHFFAGGGQRSQESPVSIFVELILGGLMLASGIFLFVSIGTAGGHTLEKLGK